MPSPAHHKDVEEKAPRTTSAANFETSLITTPLITAASIAAPHFFSVAQAEASRIKTFTKMAGARVANKAGVTYQDIVNYTKSYGEKSMSLQQYEALLANYYAGAGRRPGDFEREAESLKSLYGSMFLDQGKQSMIANAIHAERLRTASASELAYMQHSPIAETPENPFQMAQTRGLGLSLVPTKNPHARTRGTDATPAVTADPDILPAVARG